MGGSDFIEKNGDLWGWQTKNQTWRVIQGYSAPLWQKNHCTLLDSPPRTSTKWRERDYVKDKSAMFCEEDSLFRLFKAIDWIVKDGLQCACARKTTKITRIISPPHAVPSKTWKNSLYWSFTFCFLLKWN